MSPSFTAAPLEAKACALIGLPDAESVSCCGWLGERSVTRTKPFFPATITSCHCLSFSAGPFQTTAVPCASFIKVAAFAFGSLSIAVSLERM